jgi:dienelactone hydrolase
VRTTVVDLGDRPLPGVSAGSARAWAVVSVPSGPGASGPFPLAVVLHGAHGWCRPPERPRAWPCRSGAEVPNHTGLAWLTAALAASGFVAVAPGINAEFAAADASPPRQDYVGQVTAAVLERDLLGPLSRGGPVLGGALDASAVDVGRVVLVGHSRGGAVAAVLGRSDRPLSVPVRASLLLAPTSDTVDPSLLADRPTVVVLGTCDGDTGTDGGDFVSTALSQARARPVALLLVDGATHNAYNTLQGADPEFPGRPACGPTDLQEPAVQREAEAQLLPEVVRALMGLAADDPVASQLLNRTRADDRVAASVRVVHVDGAAGRTVAFTPLGPWPPRGASLRGVRATACPGGISSPFRNPGTEPCHRIELSEIVGRPPSVHLTWPGGSAADGVGGPAPSLGLPVVGRAGGVLVLRAWADPLDVAGPGELVLRITGDGPGGSWSRAVTLTVPRVGAPVSGTTVRRGAVLWSERRLVLPGATTSITLAPADPRVAGGFDLVGIDVLVPPPA